MAPAAPMVRATAARGDTGGSQLEDDGVDQVPGAGRDNARPPVFDRVDLRQVGQQPVVERPGRSEPDAGVDSGPVGQPLRAVERDDAPAVDERHAVAQPLRLVHIVG